MTETSSTPSELIDQRIAALDDWRGERLSAVRAVIHDAVPDVEETWKWRGVPVWEKSGIICTGEAYKSYLKLTFFKGAKVADPTGLFNSGLDGNARRAIDIHEDSVVDDAALADLVRAAVAVNEG